VCSVFCDIKTSSSHFIFVSSFTAVQPSTLNE
jgi:hypothetical protein